MTIERKPSLGPWVGESPSNRYLEYQVERYLSVCLNLRISITTKQNELYSSENIDTGHVMVLSYFVGSPPPKEYEEQLSQNMWCNFL